MTTAIVLFGLVCALWLLYLVRPFRAAITPAGPGRRQLLEEEKRGLLLALRDAEADHGNGRLSEADYRSIREALETRTARIIRELELAGDARGRAPVDDGLDAALERIRGQRRSARGGAAAEAASGKEVSRG